MHRFDFCVANKTVLLSTQTLAAIARIEIPSLLNSIVCFEFQLYPFFRIDFDTDNNV
jgi:hypothetical protein